MWKEFVRKVDLFQILGQFSDVQHRVVASHLFGICRVGEFAVQIVKNSFACFGINGSHTFSMGLGM